MNGFCGVLDRYNEDIRRKKNPLSQVCYTARGARFKGPLGEI